MAEALTIQVGIGELRAGKGSDTSLVAYGLGSCVGVCLYDANSRIGGLAHVMLPNSLEGGSRIDGRYADKAVPMLLEEVLKLGADRRRLVGKIAGGARMLSAPGFSDTFNIGARNVDAVQALMGQLGVPILGKEIGGSRGRTLLLHLASGRVVVRTVGEKEVDL